ncbi:MAG: hypothetical protein ACTSQL_07275 [Promethearchaeota archaeon]
MQLGQTETDPLGLIFNLLWFAMIFMSMFYGTKLQAWRSAREMFGKTQKME